MEKHQESGDKETPEDFQIQDPGGAELKMDLESLQPKDELQESKDSLHNVSEQDVLKNTEEPSVEKGLQNDLNTVVKRKNERPTEKCLARGQDTLHKTQLEVDSMHEICDEFSGDKVSEPERNRKVQKDESSIKISIIPGQNLIPIDNYDSNKEEWDKTEKIPIPSSKKALQYSCEVSEENVKVIEEQQTKPQQKSLMSNEISKTPVESRTPQYDSQVKKYLQREQELRDILTDFFSTINITSQQEFSYQKDGRNFNNAQKTKPLQQAQTTINSESGNNLNVCPQELGGNFTECRAESEDGVLATSRESKQDPSVHRSETKTGKLECGVTLPVGVYDHEPKVPQSSKDYVTFSKQKSDITACPQSMNYSSDVPRRSGDAVACFKKTKDYVTCKTNMLTSSLKTKGYVTHRPQRPEIVVPKTYRGFRRNPKPKKYVTAQPVKEIKTVSAPEPPTHIFWSPRKTPKTSSGSELPTDTSSSVRSFQEDASNPNSSTQTLEPPQSLKESASETEESRLSLKRKNMEMEQLKKKVRSLPNRTRRQQAVNLLTPLPEIDEFPLTPFEEVCCDSETEEPLVQGRTGILRPLTPPLPAGEQDSVPNMTSEKQTSFTDYIKGCMILFCISLLAGIVVVALHFATLVAVNEHSTTGSNITSTPYDSRFNMNTPMTDMKQYRQNESLDGKVSSPVTNLGIAKIDSNDIFTTPLAEFDDNITYSLADLEIESIPPYDPRFNMNIPMTDMKQYRQSESLDGKVSNPVTNLEIAKIDSNHIFTAPLAEFGDNITNSLADLEIETVPVLNNIVDTSEIDAESNL